jgi:ACS family tartrate transporter-like MFS transporter
MAGVASAIPYLVGMIALMIWGWWTDRSRERRQLFIMSAVIGSVGFVAAGVLGSSFWSLAAISLALAGLYGARPTFWPLPSLFLSAAGGHCADQLDRKRRRLCRTACRGLDQGLDGQF